MRERKDRCREEREFLQNERPDPMLALQERMSRTLKMNNCEWALWVLDRGAKYVRSREKASRELKHEVGRIDLTDVWLWIEILPCAEHTRPRFD